jgi:hypothetical protein
MARRAWHIVTSVIAIAMSLENSSTLSAGDHELDRLKELQTSYVAGAGRKLARAYHFGSQGSGNVFSNHTSHTNRLVPVYVFGKKADLTAVMGANSRYRDPEKVKATRRPLTVIKAISTGFRRKPSHGVSSTFSSSGSMVSTGRLHRQRPFTRVANSIQKARGVVWSFRTTRRAETHSTDSSLRVPPTTRIAPTSTPRRL